MQKIKKGRLSSSLCFILFFFLLKQNSFLGNRARRPGSSSADSYCCFSAFIVVIDRFFIIVCFCLFAFIYYCFCQVVAKFSGNPVQPVNFYSYLAYPGHPQVFTCKTPPWLFIIVVSELLFRRELIIVFVVSAGYAEYIADGVPSHGKTTKML